MLSVATIIAALVLYIGFLFLIAQWVERGSLHARRLAGSPLVYVLALAVYCTSWTYYGSVGNAASSGALFLTIYLGPTMMIALWWLVLRKLVRIKAAHRITSIADFISARYEKSPALAAIATIIALVGITPYIALQLKSVTSTFTTMVAAGGAGGAWGEGPIGLAVVATMTAFTIAFGARRLDPTERQPGMIVALAVQGIVKLVAFLAVGVFVTYIMYDGFGDIFQRLSESPFQGLMGRAGEDISAYLTWMTYLVLAMSAIVFLPRQFHVAVVENSDENHIRTAMWLLPLYLLLINIFVIPIAVGGLLQGQPIQEADTFVLELPLSQNRPWLALMAFIGGFSAATGMVMVSGMTTATMIVNHLVLPSLEWLKGLDFLRRNLLQVRWVVIAFVLFLGYLIERLIGESYTLVNMGLISFAAALQFAPAILGGIFWRRGNKTGSILGLSAGFLTWTYTLLLPSLVKSGWLSMSLLEQGPLGIQFLRPEQLFGLVGLSPLTHTLFWTMTFNVGLYVLGSLYFEQSEEERELADAFVDALVAGPTLRLLAYGEAHIDIASKCDVLEGLLSQYFNDVQVANIIEFSLDAVGIEEKAQISVAELAEFYGEVERVLAGSIGAAAAHRTMERDVLMTPEEASELSGMYGRILADLQVSPEELRSRFDYYEERERLLSSQATELEEMVAERTRGLKAAADVSRAATSILDVEELIQQSVELIRKRFDLYYVGLFLVGEAGKWAVLEAGTGEAGRAMLGRGHRLEVGGTSMIGWSVAHGEARIAQVAKEDAVRLATPELPETRSEAALPLRSRGQVVGALTVQSTRPGAFDEATIAVLQTMADQLAVALDNARLFAEAQEALAAERRAYGQLSGEAWQKLLRGRTEWGYRYVNQEVVPIEETPQPEIMKAAEKNERVQTEGDGAVLDVPIKVRDQAIGTLRFRKDGTDQKWTIEEKKLLDALSEELGRTLESARLYEDTQRRAARERLTGEITSRIRESLDVEAVLQVAAREMRAALNLEEAEVRIMLSALEEGDV